MKRAEYVHRGDAAKSCAPKGGHSCTSMRHCWSSSVPTTTPSVTIGSDENFDHLLVNSGEVLWPTTPARSGSWGSCRPTLGNRGTTWIASQGYAPVRRRCASSRVMMGWAESLPLQRHPVRSCPLMANKRTQSQGLKVAGLFAGIGGVELGFQRAGHSAELLCEILDPAKLVLSHWFPEVPVHADVRTLRALPKVDVLAAGFPCQDLSQAGRTAGIRGSESGLVAEVFRLLRSADPRWLVLENVPFMLQLDRGEAMRYLTTALLEHGYNWAYRIVDSRAFGLPQRRQRVLLVASRTEDPRGVLLPDDAGDPGEPDRKTLNGAACGFYWTEGIRGLGWAVDAIPTLKGGSTVGIPSPPAIALPNGAIVTPDIRDAERLQGFPADWTRPAVGDDNRRNGPRWKLVGNAVSVPVAKWLGQNLAKPKHYVSQSDPPLSAGAAWPKAAWCMGGTIHTSAVSQWPKRYKRTPLAEFLSFPGRPLSLRATAGFRERTTRSALRFPEGFLEVVDRHRALMERTGTPNGAPVS